MVKFATFEVHVEIEKLKIHVKGDREIAPDVANNVAQQISAMFQPAGLIEAPKNGHSDGHTVLEAMPPPTTRKPHKRAAAAGAPATSGTQIDWKHDPAKWGSPIQSWKQWQKIMWLLLVVEQATGTTDLSTSELVKIFKTKFRAAGLLNKGNVRRDLSLQETFFGSADGRWHLKQNGKVEAKKLLAAAKGETGTS